MAWSPFLDNKVSSSWQTHLALIPVWKYPFLSTTGAFGIWVPCEVGKLRVCPILISLDREWGFLVQCLSMIQEVLCWISSTTREQVYIAIIRGRRYVSQNCPGWLERGNKNTDDENFDLPVFVFLFAYFSFSF